MSNTKLTMTRIAFELGTKARIERKATEPIAAAYAKAKTEQRTQMRDDWCVHYMMGLGNVNEKHATTIWGKPRTERSEQHQSWANAANMSFAYHVKRDTKGDGAGMNNSADPVAKLLKGYDKLTAGEKRSFKAKLAAL